MSKLKSIPAFKTETEERKFWENPRALRVGKEAKILVPIKGELAYGDNFIGRSRRGLAACGK